MNENFIRGFVKAAIAKGLTEEQAHEVLKSAAPLPIVQGATKPKFKFNTPTTNPPVFPKMPGVK